MTQYRVITEQARTALMKYLETQMLGVVLPLYQALRDAPSFTPADEKPSPDENEVK